MRMAAVNNVGEGRGEQITFWPSRLISEERMSKPETKMRNEIGLIANQKILWFPASDNYSSVISLSCMFLPSIMQGKKEMQKDRQRGSESFTSVAVSRGSRVAFILPSAFTGLVSKSQSLFFFAFPAFCWGQLQAVQTFGGGIHHLFIRPKPQPLNAAWDGAKDNPISQLRFNPVTFLWFCYFRTEKCRELQKGAFRKNKDAEMKTVTAYCLSQYIWDRYR